MDAKVLKITIYNKNPTHDTPSSGSEWVYDPRQLYKVWILTAGDHPFLLFDLKSQDFKGSINFQAEERPMPLSELPSK
jgi:hypothetical protein